MDLLLIEMYKMVEKMNQKLEVRYDSLQAYIFSDFRGTRPVSSKTVLKRVKEEIKKMIAVSKIRGNDLTTIPYFTTDAIRIIGAARK